jgi:hypothetical protein
LNKSCKNADSRAISSLSAVMSGGICINLLKSGANIFQNSTFVVVFSNSLSLSYEEQ